MTCPECRELPLRWWRGWSLWICANNWWMEGGCVPPKDQPPHPDLMALEGVGL